MGYRLKTSEKTMEIFEYLESKTRLQPFILSKMAIALSLEKEDDIDSVPDEDTKGLELNRQTIMGEFDDLFKALIEQNLNKSLTDDEYYPKYAKKHLDRGAEMLKNNFDYNGNFRGLFEALLKGEKAL